MKKQSQKKNPSQFEAWMLKNHPEASKSMGITKDPVVDRYSDLMANNQSLKSKWRISKR